MAIPQINNNGLNMGIVGTLPGFNSNIDFASRDFEKDLLRNISFIDFIPATYSIPWVKDVIAKGLSLINVNGVTGDTTTAGLSTLYNYTSPDNTATAVFKKIVERYLGTGNDVDGVRLVASNDTVFNESISNQFDENNIIDDLTQLGTSAASKFGRLGKAVEMLANGGTEAASKVASGIIKMDYEQAFRILGSDTLNGGGMLSDLIKRKALGLTLATPHIFQKNEYQNSITVFIKLTSPTGDKADIEKYIINPLNLCLILAAPLSYDGLTYGVPFIWNIKSYGNVDFSVGAISAITITRGSMETIYNDELLPMSVDVRMTISSLSNNFSIMSPTLTLEGAPQDFKIKDVATENNIMGMATPYQNIKQLKETNIQHISLTL